MKWNTDLLILIKKNTLKFAHDYLKREYLNDDYFHLICSDRDCYFNVNHTMSVVRSVCVSVIEASFNHIFFLYFT